MFLIFKAAITEPPHLVSGWPEISDRLLGAALEAAIPKVVYVSTVGVFGNTHGQIVDESYEHPAEDFTSEYEKTKWEAHQVARRLIGEGLPCVIVQPGGVYGPGDTSSIGVLLDQFLSGKMPLIPFPDLGICLTHVEDVAAGILLALDKGKAGEAYVLSGPATTVREAIGIVAAETGHRHRVHLDRPQPRRGRRGQAGQHVGQSVAAGDGREVRGVHAVQRHVHPVHAGAGEGLRTSRQQHPVGGQREFRARPQGSCLGDNVLKVLGQQRFSTGEPHLRHAQSGHGNPNQPDNLVGRQQSLRAQPWQTIRRHAVGTPQVATIGQRHP